MKGAISVKPKMYIDPETGGMISEEEIVTKAMQRMDGHEKYDWFRLYPRNAQDLKKVVDSPKYDVLAFILSHLNFMDNSFEGSFKTIAEQTKVSESTVVRVMKTLQELDYIRPKDVRSSWMVNPAIGYAGRQGKDRFLYRIYHSLVSRLQKKQPEQDNDYQSELMGKLASLDPLETLDDEGSAADDIF